MTKHWGKTRVGSSLILCLLASGWSCEEGVDETTVGSYDHVLGVLLGGLGTEISSCTDAGSALSGTTLTLALASGEEAVISVVGGKLKVNGFTCLKDATSNTPLTSSSVTRIVIDGAGSNSVLLDLAPGSFGGIFGPSGGITINAASGMSVGVRGTENSDRYRMAQQAGGADLFLELNGNNAADVRIVGDPGSVVLTLAGGADSFDAQDTLSLTFLGAAIAMGPVLSEPLSVYGGAGADTLEGGNGDDTLDGGEGNDLFQSKAAGGDGADVFQGGAGTDSVDYSNRTAGVTVDIAPDLSADPDDGETLSNEHDDVKSDIENLRGSGEDDVLTGSTQANVIDGNAGADTLSGGPAGSCTFDSDTLNGGTGDDLFEMGALPNCADVVDGAAGRDTASYALRAGNVSVTLDSAANDGAGGESDNVKSTVEVVLGGDGNDALTGGSANDELHGGPGNDFLKGGNGHDTLVGGPGADRLLGEAGDDRFDEATNVDAAYATSMSAFGGQDVIHGGTGNNTCDFRRGGTTAASYSLCFSATADHCAPAFNDGVDGDDLTNCNYVILDGGVDTVTGSVSNDIVDGGGGGDIIDGGPGDDDLYGEAGDDSLLGGAGNDLLNGGDDQLLFSDGGPGADVCLSPNDGNSNCEI
jgi:Ca2+-binding RTX toxin-like protein